MCGKGEKIQDEPNDSDPHVNDHGYQGRLLFLFEKGSIALGAGATIIGYNQLIVATNVTQFNTASLAPSTGIGSQDSRLSLTNQNCSPPLKTTPTTKKRSEAHLTLLFVCWCLWPCCTGLVGGAIFEVWFLLCGKEASFSMH